MNLLTNWDLRLIFSLRIVPFPISGDGRKGGIRDQYAASHITAHLGSCIMNHLARAMQFIGLLEMGYGLFIGLYEGDIGREIRFAGIGGALFLIGWLLQRRLGGK